MAEIDFIELAEDFVKLMKDAQAPIERYNMGVGNDLSKPRIDVLTSRRAVRRLAKRLDSRLFCMRSPIFTFNDGDRYLCTEKLQVNGKYDLIAYSFIERLVD